MREQEARQVVSAVQAVAVQLAGVDRAVRDVAVRLPEEPVRLAPVPRAQRGGGPGLWAMAAQFKAVVPAAYLTERGVRCVCGAETVLERPFVACSGGCRRFFMPVAGGARSAGPYPAEDAA